MKDFTRIIIDQKVHLYHSTFKNSFGVNNLDKILVTDTPVTTPPPIRHV